MAAVRSPIRDSFDEHYATIRWWAERGKPLEINDPHQWGLRYASDDLQTADHVLVAVIALKLGIKNYVMQQMFELPPTISALDDLAKMKAACELIAPLEDHFDYHIIRECRSGLPSFPPNLNRPRDIWRLASTHNSIWNRTSCTWSRIPKHITRPAPMISSNRARL